MAVYTEVSKSALDDFMGAYDLGPVVSFEGIVEGVENTNYALRSESGRYVLTLYEKRVAADDLPFFLGLMEHLAGRGIACPVPVHGRDGQALRTLCGRPAAITSFLEGRPVEHIAARHCRQVGAALATLHRSGATYTLRRANALSVASWRRLLAASAARAHEIAPNLEETIEAEIAALEPVWPEDLPAGIIHGDLFPDNLFFQGDGLSGIIDFYLACVDALAYDLAICLNAWCFDRSAVFDRARAVELFAGYGSVRPLSQAEVAAFPKLARGAAVRFLLTRVYDTLHPPKGALVKPKQPLNYLKRLEFHRAAAEPDAYGLPGPGS